MTNAFLPLSKQPGPANSPRGSDLACDARAVGWPVGPSGRAEGSGPALSPPRACAAPERRADGATAPPASGAGGPPPLPPDVHDNNHAHPVPFWVLGCGSAPSRASLHGNESESETLMPDDPEGPRRPGRPRVYPAGDDRRRRYEQAASEAGFTRLTLRCHVDDVERVRRYVWRLNRSREVRQ